MPALMNVYRWFLPMISSVYLGIAEEASDEAYRALGSKGSTARTDTKR